MMSQVRNWSKSSIFNLQSSIILAVLLLVAGCENVDPFVNPGKVEDPHWAITVDNDLPSSLTAIVKVSLAEKEGTLAAFIGNECCGIAEYKAEYDLYWLYISAAAETGGDVQLRFYSPELKRIFDATTTFPYSNTVHLGSRSQPYSPDWKAAD